MWEMSNGAENHWTFSRNPYPLELWIRSVYQNTSDARLGDRAALCLHQKECPFASLLTPRPKTHPCPNPVVPSSPLHCHLRAGCILNWGKKPGAHPAWDEFSPIGIKDSHAALPVPSPVPVLSSHWEAGGSPETWSPQGAGL